MKRDWDVIRQVLIEVESLDQAKNQTATYGPVRQCADPVKAQHAVLLAKAGYIEGWLGADLTHGDEVVARDLTWDGHELAKTIRGEAVWEQVKKLAKEKGVELTFDTVKALAKLAVPALLGLPAQP